MHIVAIYLISLLLAIYGSLQTFNIYKIVKCRRLKICWLAITIFCVILEVFHAASTVYVAIFPASLQISSMGIMLLGSAGIFACITRLMRSSAESIARIPALEKLVYVDHLTGVGNRRAFEDFFAARENRQYKSLSIIDIDYFKSVNDRYGHSVGDLAIQHIASIAKQSLSDEKLYRIGGEEFAVLSALGLHDVLSKMEILRENIEKSPLLAQDEKIFITVSVGVAELSEENNARDLMINADTALYESKRNGRNTVSMHMESTGNR